VSRRPKIYWRTLAIAGPGLLGGVAYAAVHDKLWLGGVLVVVFAAGFLGPWLLYPYSRIARRLQNPTDEELDRSLRFADRLGRIPVFGAVWRFAERISNHTGRGGGALPTVETRARR
jgi:hypothetical protein